MNGRRSNDAAGSRRCTRCPTMYPPHLVERAFRADYCKRVCGPCKDLARDQRKQRNRWQVKARDVVRHHAARLGIDRNELVTVYGWDPQQLARDAERQYASGCNYCPGEYVRPGDVTLDIQDPNRPPYYRTNTKWCCQTCNRGKGATSPEAFEADLQILNLWERSKNEPPEQGMLFEAG